MPFLYNIDEKNCFQAGATVSVEFAHSPYVCVGFLGTPVSSSIPKLCTLAVLAWLYCPSVSERGCGYERPWDGRDFCLGWVPTLHPELPREAPATLDSELENKQTGK